jgi:hypothetical protein
MADRVNITGVVGVDALTILRTFEGISASPPRLGRTRKGALAMVRFGDVSVLVRIESRAYVNAATAWAITRNASDSPNERVLVVTAQSSAEGREILRSHGIGYACGSGHLSLSAPGLLLRLDEPRTRPRPTPTTRFALSGIAGRIAQMLLLEPDRDWTIRTLSARSGASVGLTHAVVERLESNGILEASGTGPARVRRLLGRAALLDIWCEEQLDRDVQVVRCLRPAPHPRDLMASLAAGFARTGIAYALTRAAATMTMTSAAATLRAVEVWVDSSTPFDEVLDAVGARHTEGNANLILTRAKGDPALAFAQERNGLSCVNPVRLYYDLGHDPRRDREEFRLLREAILGR